MPSWLIYSLYSACLLFAFTVIFFFTFTRGALILRRIIGGPQNQAAHVYPIYSNMRLIRLVDFQLIISAILLFQYDRLVMLITSGLCKMNLSGKNVLITSCAFGNVIPKIVSSCDAAGVSKVLIIDIIKNELVNARSKIKKYDRKIEYFEQNATAVSLADGSISANVIFFYYMNCLIS